MMKPSEPADSSLKLLASPSINYAVILTLLGVMFGGVWFLATQTALNQGVAERQTKFESTINARLDASDKREDMRAEAVTAIANRLTKIEAQLSYLVAAGGNRR